MFLYSLIFRVFMLAYFYERQNTHKEIQEKKSIDIFVSNS